jgi:hypothetical protein
VTVSVGRLDLVSSGFSRPNTVTHAGTCNRNVFELAKHCKFIMIANNRSRSNRDRNSFGLSDHVDICSCFGHVLFSRDQLFDRGYWP